MATCSYRRGGASDLGQDEENVYGKLKFFWDDQARSDATSKANVKKARRLEKTVGELEAALADSLERMRPARIVDMTRSCIIYVLTADKDQDIPSRIQQAQSAELPHLDSTAAQPVEEDKEEQRGHLSLNWQEKEIQQVPNVIWKNPEYEFLAFLYLDRNLISEIPDALSNMKNNIKIIPDYISKHTRLVTLALSFNQISEIPQAVGDLKYLQYLNLFSNLIKEIPMALHRCERLEDLNVGRNPLLSEEEVTGSSVLRIPQEILQRQKSGRGFDPRSFVKLLRMQERSTSK
ncbi:hypothetical protein GUITHDRAFT_116394 [Guillardia theta CCMP2712]|uniref:Uncharacterized protein n=1 Tax=Guillardia theta (strain CCMP2712) TaxID=905079 RepID=L1IMC8_GUITC|nr:hypothetical protein GUITHDRAFT_116394 [Guillardia theta CCMP2712]EKX37433.1 hypothetical protein GUITHDRAFT_116394 [Guillardia theta CCMP2712]|eukprot:XP_005824413.1 hypothetical protein GUITHDRAFT_116394 [Guillardia theta CCMP2712]